MVLDVDKNKRIAKNTILLYIRSVFLLFITLYSSRLTLNVLGVEDYGIYQVVGGVVTMFSMISSTLNAASQRFITYSLGENDLEKVKKVFSTCITLHLLLGVILAVIVEVAGLWFLYNKLNIPTNRIEVASYVMHCSITTLFINIISVPFNSVIIAHERMGAFAYISLLEGLLRLFAVLVLTYLVCDKLLVFAIFYLFIAILIRCIYSVYCTLHFEETRRANIHLDSKLFKGMFAFAGWNLVGSSALVLRNQGVDILLNLFFGVSVNAAKGISNQIQSAAQQLVGNFTTSLNPQLTISIAQRDEERRHVLITNGGKMAFFLMTIIAVPFIVNADSVMSLWLITVPNYAVELSVLSFVYILTDTQSRFLINSVLANGKIKTFQLILGGLKMLSVPLTWCLLKLGGNPLTGMFVNIALQFVCLYGELKFSNKYIHLDSKKYFNVVVIRCWITFLIALLISFIFYYVLSDNAFVSIPISFVITCICILAFGINKTEKMFIKTMIIRKRNEK